jgi:kynurenine formamidase
MKTRTFIVGCILAVAVFLFAQHRQQPAQSYGFREVIDLTHPISSQAATSVYRIRTAGAISPPEDFGTNLDAPAHFARGLWAVDQIPAERLVAPLVVLDVTSNAEVNADYQVSVEDIARYEQAHGQIPLNAVVMAHTGWESRWNSANAYRNVDAKGTSHFPGYSLDAAKFLFEGRSALGLGTDTPSVDYGASRDFPVRQYTFSHSLNHLENVANLEHAPANGGIVLVAPMKLEGGSAGPVRILALVR